jgi:hypothetical protein
VAQAGTQDETAHKQTGNPNEEILHTYFLLHSIRAPIRTFVEHFFSKPIQKGNERGKEKQQTTILKMVAESRAGIAVVGKTGEFEEECGAKEDQPTIKTSSPEKHHNA